MLSSYTSTIIIIGNTLIWFTNYNMALKVDKFILSISWTSKLFHVAMVNWLYASAYQRYYMHTWGKVNHKTSRCEMDSG